MKKTSDQHTRKHMVKNIWRPGRRGKEEGDRRPFSIALLKAKNKRESTKKQEKESA